MELKGIFSSNGKKRRDRDGAGEVIDSASRKADNHLAASTVVISIVENRAREICISMIDIANVRSIKAKAILHYYAVTINMK